MPVYPVEPTVRAEIQRKAREKMKKARLEAKERKARQDSLSPPPKRAPKFPRYRANRVTTSE